MSGLGAKRTLAWNLPIMRPHFGEAQPIREKCRRRSPKRQSDNNRCQCPKATGKTCAQQHKGSERQRGEAPECDHKKLKHKPYLEREPYQNGH